MLKMIAGAMSAILLTGAVQAAPLNPTEIVNRHIGAKGDIDKIMADYAEDAVVLQPGRAIEGKAAIRALFEKMFPRRPEGAAAPSASGAPAAARPAMKVTRVWEEGDVGFLTWEMGATRTTEEFLVRDGKIVVQALFMSTGAPPAS
ncbi:MAG TPA: nuclear transport factor 2 family protein [Sphingobium sp.]|nr:nuclear transport factor 2 family protein [Sphingobium sp.]